MDKSVQLWELHREVIAERVKGQAKDFIDSVCECRSEITGYDDTLEVLIGDHFNEGWAVMLFDLESGEPLAIMGQCVRGIFDAIKDMVKLDTPFDTYQDIWEIHTREGNTYRVADYMEYEDNGHMAGHSEVYKVE